MNIEERLQKGTDLIHSKRIDPEEEDNEKAALLNARRRVQEILERIESELKSDIKEQ